jgi:hypothetical protein
VGGANATVFATSQIDFDLRAGQFPAALMPATHNRPRLLLLARLPPVE